MENIVVFEQMISLPHAPAAIWAVELWIRWAILQPTLRGKPFADGATSRCAPEQPVKGRMADDLESHFPCAATVDGCTFDILKSRGRPRMQARTLIPSALAVMATAIVGARASRPADSPWYRSLRKPPYQPPSTAFPIIWPVLYADIALVSSTVLDELERQGITSKRRRYITALFVNLVMNAGWSWLFFNRRLLGTSAVVAAALAVSSADLTRRGVSVQGVRAAPLGLYALWCGFATVLATHVWLLNRR
jgi:translocator protein